MYKEEIDKLHRQYSQDIHKLKEAKSIDHMKYSERKDSEIEKLKKESEYKISSIEETASQEKEKLMTKGKAMMKEIKEKKEKKIQELHEEIDFLEKKVMEDEQEKTRLGAQFTTKLTEYKKKLRGASSRINALLADLDDYEDKIKSLERERSKLKEENERYRHQIGGRSDSALQSQLELLQNEFQDVVDENRKLRRNMHGQTESLPPMGEQKRTRPYTRDRANQSTLSAMREDYEETINSLTDEKRELIMKHSAALAHVQKAEKRAWEVDQENAKLKQDITSLRLALERNGTMSLDQN